MDFYNPYMVPTLFARHIIIFQGVLTKFNFLMKFPHLEKFAKLIKDLKYEHQSILVLTKFNFLMKFPHLEKFAKLIKDLKYEHQSILSLWERVKLNFRDRYGKPNIFSENLSHCQVFSTNCQKMTLWHHWGLSQGVSDAPHDGGGDRCLL